MFISRAARPLNDRSKTTNWTWTEPAVSLYCFTVSCCRETLGRISLDFYLWLFMADSDLFALFCGRFWTLLWLLLSREQLLLGAKPDQT